MTLDRFLGLVEGELKRFEVYWRRGHKGCTHEGHAGAHFPLELPAEEWWELFQEYSKLPPKE